MPYCDKNSMAEHGEKLYEITEIGQGKVLLCSLFVRVDSKNLFFWSILYNQHLLLRIVHIY